LQSSYHKTLIVIGGGAAGVFCAVTAARLNPKLQVIIVEKTSKLLQKVKHSGGGRCNVTHACFEIEEMSNRYPRGKHFVKKTFHQFFTTDTVQWFEQRGIALKTEQDGRMFPKANTSQAIIDCLENEISKYKVEVQFHKQVTLIEPIDTGFEIHFNEGQIKSCNYVVLACGGQNKIEQFNWLQNLSFKVAAPVPSLFTFNFPNHPLNALTGVSVPNVTIKIAGFKMHVNGPVLITHWGISGPAVLKLSAFAAIHLAELNYRYQVIVNWCSSHTEISVLEQIQRIRNNHSAQKVVNGNFTDIPARLWQFLLQVATVDDLKRWADLTNNQMNKLAVALCNYKIEANGKTTYKDEFVTAGGIELSEVDANTMMSRRYPGLYFGGEILNVDGITGGYNFQHAWTSGFIAGKHIAASAEI
jgi:predicted Rossmann fold flavoprotein